MDKASIPLNEERRLQTLINLNILDTPIQKPFELIVRVVKKIFDVPIVAFSLIDAERQWFKAIEGLDICETNRDVSFCAHTINQDDIFLINDTLADERFIDNPLVTNDPKIRFYAGYPIYSANESKIGSLCIIDQRPRNYTREDLSPLKDMAALVEMELEAKKITLAQTQLIKELNTAKKAQYIDPLTHVWNRAGLQDLFARLSLTPEDHLTAFGVAIVDIDNFKKVNDTYGHLAGDAVLREVAKSLVSTFRENDIVGRWGGEEFVIFITADNKKTLLHITNRARVAVSESSVLFDAHSITVSVTIGLSIYQYGQPVSLENVIAKADAALYQGKRTGKNKVIENWSGVTDENNSII